MAITKVDKTLLEATGTADATTFLRGDGSWASASAGFNSVQILTSSQTWNKPAGITKVVVEVQGAGGVSSQGNGVQWGGNGGAGGGGGSGALNGTANTGGGGAAMVGNGGSGIVVIRYDVDQ